MAEIRLSPARQRRMKKLAERVDTVSQSDRRYFECHPDRQHRTRMACEAEIEQHELLSGESPWLPPGTRSFIAVRNIAPGFRMRLGFRGLDGAELDLSEDMARAIFEASANPKTWEVEAQLRKAAEIRG
jgi:hypothetical protein